MVRQCAWCLRLIDSIGERLSPAPLPKLYEASHGMCSVCGALWMKQVLEAQIIQETPLWDKNKIDMTGSGNPCIEAPSVQSQAVTDLVLELQQREHVV